MITSFQTAYGKFNPGKFVFLNKEDQQKLNIAVEDRAMGLIDKNIKIDANINVGPEFGGLPKNIKDEVGKTGFKALVITEAADCTSGKTEDAYKNTDTTISMETEPDIVTNFKMQEDKVAGFWSNARSLFKKAIKEG